MWIATEFREEHRQALDWLNTHTGGNVRFFGIELRMVRIGTSAPAPLLDVVAEPNDWARQVRDIERAARVTGKGQFYLEFWAKYLGEVRQRHPDWTRARKSQPDNWMSFPSPVRGTSLNPGFAQGGRLRHEIYIDTGDGNENLTIFKHLLDRRQTLERAYGRPLEFEELPGKRACRVAEYTAGDVSEEDRHGDFVAWLIDAGERLRRALGEVGAP